jgi:hypothetical protein
MSGGSTPEPSGHGAVANAGPGDPPRPEQGPPEVVVLEDSPSYHDPAVDAVDGGEKLALWEARRRDIPPCPHCFPGWGR